MYTRENVLADLGGKLYRAFIDHECGVRSQWNYFQPPQRLIKNIRVWQFVEGLDLCPLALAVDFNALVVVSEQVGVCFFVLFLALPIQL